MERPLIYGSFIRGIVSLTHTMAVDEVGRRVSYGRKVSGQSSHVVKATIALAYNNIRGMTSQILPGNLKSFICGSQMQDETHGCAAPQKAV